MTDRELLELAAKAYGITGAKSKHGHWVIADQNGARIECCYGWPKFCQSTGKALDPSFYDALVEMNWNPLEDDGDAFRLAIKLRINLTLDDDTNEFYVVANRFDGPKLNNGFIAQESSNGDDLAATRRAIVGAAAEIGRAM